jgi:HEAT repeats
MRGLRQLTWARVTTLLLLAGTVYFGEDRARAGGVGWSIGINLGYPGYYRPWYGCANWYYPPPLVVAVPPPVYVAPPVSVVQPVYPAAPPAAAQPAPQPSADLPPPRPLEESQLPNADRYIRDLTNPDERLRLEAALQLGRSRSVRAVDPLAATLAGDASSGVREAAAKALALIGSPTAMPALRRAAQQDSSHDVRRTAQFAIEIIQAK